MLLDKRMHLLAAIDNDGGIGYQGGLPWECKSDMRRFVRLTRTPISEGVRNVVVMGSGTYKSLYNGALKDRLNIVVTGSPSRYAHDGIVCCTSLEGAFSYCERVTKEVLGRLFVIGGPGLWNEAARHARCGTLYLSQLTQRYVCDKFWQPFGKLCKTWNITNVDEEKDVNLYEMERL